MRKTDEVLLYEELTKIKTPDYDKLIETFNKLNINLKRANFILTKWVHQGYWEFGINPWFGWLTNKKMR